MCRSPMAPIVTCPKGPALPSGVRRARHLRLSSGEVDAKVSCMLKSKWAAIPSTDEQKSHAGAPDQWCIRRQLRFEDFAQAFDFKGLVDAESNEQGHFPESLDVIFDTVTIDLRSEDCNGISSRDFKLAERVNRIYDICTGTTSPVDSQSTNKAASPCAAICDEPLPTISEKEDSMDVIDRCYNLVKCSLSLAQLSIDYLDQWSDCSNLKPAKIVE